MPRKRVSFTKPRNYKEDYTTKEELRKLVWEMPLYKVAEIFKTTVDYIKKWCYEWWFARPDPQYFSQLMRRKLKLIIKIIVNRDFIENLINHMNMSLNSIF